MMNNEEAGMARLTGIVRNSYLEYSMLKGVATLLDYQPQSQPTRLLFERNVVIDHWMDPNYVHDLIFYELARVIGLSEQKFVVDRLLNEAPKERVDRYDLEMVRGAVADMRSDGDVPTALVLPIELYQDVFQTWSTHGLMMQYHPQRLTIDGVSLRLYWSNKYNAFSNAFVVSENFATWVARPTREVRIEVDYQLEGVGCMRVDVRSRFDYRIANARAIRAFESATSGSAQTR